MEEKCLLFFSTDSYSVVVGSVVWWIYTVTLVLYILSDGFCTYFVRVLERYMQFRNRKVSFGR